MGIVKHLLPLSISILGMVLSYHFLKPSAEIFKKRFELVPVARVKAVENIVFRKAKNSLSWVEVREGQELFEGDFVKTEKSSMASITFIGLDSEIKIEELTTTLIEKMNDKLQLNVISGNLFIQSVEKNINRLQVIAKDKSIDVSNADFKISVAEEKLNLDVFRGEIIDSSDKNIKYSENTSTEFDQNNEKNELKVVKIKKPNYGENILIKEGDALEIELGNAQSLSDFSIYIGKEDDELFEYKGKIKKDGQMIQVFGLEGDIYWQVKENSSSSNRQQSIVYKNKISVLSAPVLNNLNSSTKLVTKEGSPILFTWNSSPFSIEDRIIVEDLSGSKLLDQVATERKFSGLNSLESGKFKWYVQSKMKNGIVLESKKSALDIVRTKEEPPPKIIFPENNAVFFTKESFEKMDLSIFWEKKTDKVQITIYRIDSKELIVRKTIDSEQIKVSNLRSGKYKLSISNYSTFNVEPIEDTVYFEISKPQEIEWLVEQKTYFYSNDILPIRLKWSQSNEVDKFEIIVTNQKGQEVFQKFVRGDQTIFYPEEESRFKAVIKGLDKKENVISRSSDLFFQIKKRPLLAAPIPAFSGKKVVGTGLGKVNFEFKQNPSAKRMKIEIKSLSGEVVRQQFFSQSNGEISGLLPGSYIFTANFVDGEGLEGERSETFELLIPLKSSISAPKVKGIKIQ